MTMADKPMARGFLSKLIMGFEREYGVMPVAPKGYDLPFNTFGVSMSKTLTAAGTLRGTRNPQEPIPGRTDVSGDIQVPLDYVCMGYWFRALFGLPETTGGESSGLYTHAFKLHNDMESLWFETMFATNPANYVLTNGIKLSTLNVDMGGDGELVASIGTMGKVQTISPTSKAGSPSSPGFLRCNNDMGKLLLDGVEYGDATAFGIKLDNGLDGDTYTIGQSSTRAAISEGLATVSGTITVLFKDMELVNAALSLTPKKAEVVFARGDNTLTFTLEELLFQTKVSTIDGPAGIRLPLDWQAYHSSGSLGSALAVTLKNTHASYADA